MCRRFEKRRLFIRFFFPGLLGKVSFASGLSYLFFHVFGSVLMLVLPPEHTDTLPCVRRFPKRMSSVS